MVVALGDEFALLHSGPVFQWMTLHFWIVVAVFGAAVVGVVAVFGAAVVLAAVFGAAVAVVAAAAAAVAVLQQTILQGQEVGY